MRIFYGISGEGLGHCNRTLALIDHFPKEWEIHIFTWGDAFDFLQKQKYPYLYQIASFHYGRKKGKVSYLKSAWNLIQFIKNFRSSFQFIFELAHQLNPALFISDFEAILPRVAKKMKKGFISIDNQHALSHCYLMKLPWKLRWKAYGVGVLIRLYIPKPNLIIITSFYFDFLKAKKSKSKLFITQPFLRKSDQDLKNDYLLLHYNDSFELRILKVLSQMGKKVRVYGNRGPFFPNLEYYKTSDRFTEQISGCKAIFCTAGHQLLSEAIFYGKPVFAFPKKGQIEQQVNAFYIQNQKYGMSCYLENLDEWAIREFLDQYQPLALEKRVNGAQAAVKIIQDYLEQKI